MTRERADRLQKIAEEMGTITKAIGPSLIRLAHLRQEAKQILRDSGVDPDQVIDAQGT